MHACFWAPADTFLIVHELYIRQYFSIAWIRNRYNGSLFHFPPHQVNIVCTKIKGEPLYEVVKPIAAHQELIVYYLLEQHERPEDYLFMHMRSSLYRKTLNSILEGELSIS